MPRERPYCIFEKTTQSNLEARVSNLHGKLFKGWVLHTARRGDLFFRDLTYKVETGSVGSVGRGGRGRAKFWCVVDK